MADLDPVPPRGAAIGGRIVEAIGWVIVVLAAALIVLQFVLSSASVAGIVLAVFVAIAGGATVATGRSIERSRQR